MIQIKLEGETVNLYAENGATPKYSIRKCELPLTRIEKKIKTSEWVDQLHDKTWIEKDTLYELACLIEIHFPDNEIDWRATFFPVEKESYLAHVINVKEMTADDSQETDVFDTIKIGQEEQSEEVNNTISKIVEQKLNEYKLK